LGRCLNVGGGRCFPPFLYSAMKRNIKVNLSPCEAFDIGQYFINTLEMLQRIEVKNGGLKYHETRIKRTFQTVAAGIFNQITEEQGNEIIQLINKEETEYNQTKNN
jgi:hypothetical protein